jgi:hypothetical protein
LALLRQPGGFEGSLQIETPFEANDLAVAEGPGVRLFLDLAAARTASVAADGGDHGIAKAEQFMKLMPVRGRRPTSASQGEVTEYPPSGGGDGTRPSAKETARLAQREKNFCDS